MQPRWYQQESIDSVLDYFRSGKTGNPVIALPTGAGKSIVIAGLQQQALDYWPEQRFLNLTHVKELVQQNASKISKMWPTAPMGINSAGLKRRDYTQAVIFAGIGSIAKNPAKLGHRDLVIIDECHMVSAKAESMYYNVLTSLKDINPALKVVGLTATKFRMGHGLLTNSGGLFTDICYDMTTIDGFGRLLTEGFLAPLYPKKTDTELDVSAVGTANGDFKVGQLQNAVDKPDVTQKALLELCAAGWDRKSWLIFASGVEHAEHIADLLNEMGIPCAAVHSKTKDRDDKIDAFKRGDLRCLVNNNVLTTGFDYPPIDLIGMLRPTMSPGLWVQMLGRGTRPWPDAGYVDLSDGERVWVAGGKSHCLVLDFAGNTKRLGPINDPNIPKKRGSGAGDAPVRICEACGTYNHASATVCMCCGEEFPRAEKINAVASNDELMRGETPVIETFSVTKVLYHKHTKKGTNSVSMRVDYYVGVRRFSEWVHFGRTGIPDKRAKDWWYQRHAEEPPVSVDQALFMVSQLRVPKTIKVWVNKKFPEILTYEY